jgi:hypothetical protein
MWKKFRVEWGVHGLGLCYNNKNSNNNNNNKTKTWMDGWMDGCTCVSVCMWEFYV